MLKSFEGEINLHDLARFIDHTLLKPDAQKADIIQLCQEAKKYKFKAVCVNPTWVWLCKEQLVGTNTEVCTVIGFPLGANLTETKVYEVKQAIRHGATELDMVINIGALKSGDEKLVQEDIESIVAAADDKAIVKVIIETALLTKEEKKRACQLAKNAGAHYVKTSTGFSGGGATIEDIELMKEVVGSDVLVKASGGVSDYETAKKMIEHGASRIGTSSGIKLVTNINL